MRASNPRRATALGLCVLGCYALGGALGCVIAAAPAGAEPPPTPMPAPPVAPVAAAPVAAAPVPGPPGLIPPLDTLGGVLAQAGSAPTGPLGLPDLSAYAPALLLGQNPQPAPPGAPTTPALPSLAAFDPAYLVPLNEEPAAPGAGTTGPGLAPTDEIPGTGRIAFLHRLYEMYQAGALKGALLGQSPTDEFGQPLLPPN